MSETHGLSSAHETGEVSLPESGAAVLSLKQLEAFFTELRRRGFELIGPTIREEAIVYDSITSVRDLPANWTDEQAPGRYRLQRRSDGALFGYAVGPHSWKRFLFPPREKLWESRRSDSGVQFIPPQRSARKMAFIGMRACELAAIAIQDRVFLEGQYVDPIYQANRDGAFFVAVNCGQSASVCFCSAIYTGPEARVGFDIALTELIDAAGHRFLARSGSPQGSEVLNALQAPPADDVDQLKARSVVEATRAQMAGRFDNTGVPELLAASREHTRWDEVAKRCLTCANCTMVCPTCFCSTVEDVTDLTGDNAERWRKWDSCFTMDFSYLHGGSVRQSTQSRYRQWLTHKMSTWVEQFGTSGCVGCGRCITWCPASIDLREEVNAMRELKVITEPASKRNDAGKEPNNDHR